MNSSTTRCGKTRLIRKQKVEGRTDLALLVFLYSSFSQLGNSGKSAISVSGKGLTNVKKYVERKVFSKGTI